ncbi:MAG TPA: NAD-dependent epimerase/dehydratase family protein, partial [Parachlamydiaceae bacterium]|nr:NAD-dependent epimerase/dehydratase family protein [Parachlamydiaceae bacterium]
MHRTLYFFIAMVLFSTNFLLEGKAGEDNRKKTVLIVGGAGYIGSHVNKDLIDAGYKSIVLDNLYRGTEDAVYTA